MFCTEYMNAIAMIKWLFTHVRPMFAKIINTLKRIMQLAIHVLHNAWTISICKRLSNLDKT